MASDFGTMSARMLEEAQKPGKLTFAKRSIVAALAHYAGFRATFSEKKGTVSLTAGTDEYDPPADFLAMDSLYWKPSDSSRYEPMMKQTLDTMRRLKWGSNIAGPPKFWCIHHKKLILYPTPSVTGDLLDCWYLFDSTLRTDAGHEGEAITAASADAASNDWFAEGEVALRYYALADFSVSCTGDMDKANSYGMMALKAEADLLADMANLKKPGRIQSIW